MEDQQKGLKRKALNEDAQAEPAEKNEGGSPAEKDVSNPRVGKKPPSRGGEPMSGSEPNNAEPDGAHPDDAPSGRKSTRFRMILLLSTAVFLLLGSGGFVIGKFKAHLATPGKGVQKLEPVTSIMRPIPLPDYREILDFLLAYDVRGQRMLTALRMEVGYQSPARYLYFREQNVAFRDTIYAFMLRQNLSGNSVKSWHSLLEKDLLDFLRVKLPQGFPDTICLTQVEDLPPQQ